MDINDCIKQISTEYRADPRAFILSRLFGLTFMILCLPALGLFFELSGPEMGIHKQANAAWFDAHPILHAVGLLSVVVLLVGPIAMAKLNLLVRAQKPCLAIWGVSMVCASCVWLLLMTGR